MVVIENFIRNLKFYRDFDYVMIMKSGLTSKITYGKLQSILKILMLCLELLKNILKSTNKPMEHNINQKINPSIASSTSQIIKNRKNYYPFLL